MRTLLVFLFLCLGLSLNINAQKINCGSTPSLPDKSWSIAMNPTVDDIVDFSKVNYKLIKLPEGSKITDFEKNAKMGLNASTLEFFLKNPQLIPEDWKGKIVIFTGTLFKDGGGSPLYKTLFYQDEKWQWGKAYPEYFLENTYQLQLL